MKSKERSNISNSGGVIIISPFVQLAKSLEKLLDEYRNDVQNRNDIWRLLDYTNLRWPNSKSRIIEDKNDWDQYFQMRVGEKEIKICTEDLTIEEVVKRIEEEVSKANESQTKA